MTETDTHTGLVLISTHTPECLQGETMYEPGSREPVLHSQLSMRKKLLARAWLLTKINSTAYYILTASSVVLIIGGARTLFVTQKNIT